MREIKFNFYNIHTKQYMRWEESNAGMNICSFYTHDHLIFLQYTGLKDKNGVEIYEGDVLEYYDLRKGVFIFKEQPKRREVISWSQNDAQFRIPDMGFRIDTDKVEVVGNRFENLELMEADK